MTDAGGQQTVPDIPLQRRWIGLGIVAFLVAAMIYFSVKTAAFALECGCSPLWVRISLFAVSALVMLPALYLIVTPLHRKWKTGRFLMTPTESAAKRAEYRSKMGAGKPFWPQAWIWSITLVWALFFAILGAVAIAGAVYFGRSSWVVLILFLLLAAVALFLPGWMLFKAVQRKLKSGSFLPSQEELDAARARCAKPKIVEVANFDGSSLLLCRHPLYGFRASPPSHRSFAGIFTVGFDHILVGHSLDLALAGLSPIFAAVCASRHAGRTQDALGSGGQLDSVVAAGQARCASIVRICPSSYCLSPPHVVRVL
jgi:hypothetical protein